ncbi:MAG TPA: uridine diphosphate-N-acetylglucosamine-binding protein YvcK [Vicinamibacterales bacterium]|jgi:uncharacterized cofD-like protein|nr:uridine diphosphate-N-acetylglucosamine-binding protein YvcK [Vicinamibacterales bacterium]
MMRSGEQAAAGVDLPPPYVRRPVEGPRVVAIGGGTGLPNVLRGMRPLLYAVDQPAARDRLTAIVATTDDGGSSGRLRSAFGIIPPGDIRNCLAAMSEDEGVLTALFQYRFDGGDGLNGHALGNLMLAALADVTRDTARAVELAGRFVGARGLVLPATIGPVTLVADLDDGRTVHGETAIASAGSPVRRLSLTPENPATVPEVTQAILSADVVVIGPGSLFTSVIAPLLVPEIRDAVAATPAVRIYVLNLMAEPGETDRFSAAEHLAAITQHAGARMADFVLYNTATVPEALQAQYGGQGARPIRVDRADLDAFVAMDAQAIGLPLAAEHPANRIRHHPRRLGAAIVAIARGRLGAWCGRPEPGEV